MLVVLTSPVVALEDALACWLEGIAARATAHLVCWTAAFA
jgi:hypothetical protein